MNCTDIDILKELGQNAEYWLLLILLASSEEKGQDEAEKDAVVRAVKEEHDEQKD